MLRVIGIEGRTVEEVDAAVVKWQEGLKTSDPDKVLQVVECTLHIRETEQDVPVMLSIVYALMPRHPQSRNLLVPAAGGMQ